MFGWLKQSTAATIVLGPFLDSTDGVTAETALTISQADVRLSKNAGTFAQANDANAAAHMENGYYSKALNATDTNTLGRLTVGVSETGAIPVRHDFLVVPAHVYDSVVGNANGPAPAFGILDIGTAQSVASTSITLRTGFSATDDVIIGATVWVYSSTNGLHERRTITDWNNTTKVATVDAWTQTPSGTVSYVVYATAPGSVTLPAPANIEQWRGSVPNALTSGRVDATVGLVQDDVITATSIATGAIDADAIATDAITAAKLAADAITEIQSGLATAAALTTVDGKIDTIDTNVDTILTENVLLKRNTAVAALPFYMKLTDGSPGTGLTVTVQVSKDGGAFATVAGSVTEISGGWYEVDLTAAETNAKFVAFKATAAGAEQRNFLIVTQD